MADKHNRSAEDVIEYSLFPEVTSVKDEYEQISALSELTSTYLTFLSPWLIDVIWQNEGLNLSPALGKGLLCY